RDSQGCDRRSWRPEFANACRRHRPHIVVAQTRRANRLRACCDRVDGSARERAYACAAALSLGLWYTAMSLETSRHGVQLELSRAGLVQFAEYLVFPDHPCGRYANRRFVLARLAALWRVECSDAICHYVSGDGSDSRDARLHSRARTDCARLAHFADAFDLPSDAQLLHLESDPARGERRLGQLGQTRAYCQRTSTGIVIGNPEVFRAKQ